MSELLNAAHEMASALHNVGAMDEITMRKIDALCIPNKKIFSKDDVRIIRKKTRLSQAVFAEFLGIGKTTVQQWERGDKRPSGPSCRLLDLVDRKGIEALC
jgi:putative transcriptional regulator